MLRVPEVLPLCLFDVQGRRLSARVGAIQRAASFPSEQRTAGSRWVSAFVRHDACRALRAAYAVAARTLQDERAGRIAAERARVVGVLVFIVARVICALTRTISLDRVAVK